MKEPLRGKISKLPVSQLVLVIDATCKGRGAEELVAEHYKSKGFKVEKISGNSDKYETGVPDFVAIKNHEKKFVEVKNQGGGLSKTQLEWILRHDEEDIEIVWVLHPTFLDKIKRGLRI